jgi:hypothetical protein
MLSLFQVQQSRDLSRLESNSQERTRFVVDPSLFPEAFVWLPIWLGGLLSDQFWVPVSECHPKLRENSEVEIVLCIHA